MFSFTDDAIILSAVAGAVTTIIILLEFRHMEKHRNLEITMQLFEWAESERLRKAFRWIEREFHFEDYDKYKAFQRSDQELSDHPYEVTAFFEQVGFLVEKKFVDLDVIIDSLSPDITANWKKLEPWIMALRREESDKTFGRHFQKLYERTVAFNRQD
jgi:hypothetical protein